MDPKFNAGLANQVMTEFDNIKKLHEEFIGCDAPIEKRIRLRGMMQELLEMYFEFAETHKE